MKRMMMLLGITGVALTGYAEKVDILKPVYQRQEKELNKIMEQLAARGLEYDIVDDEIKINQKTHPGYHMVKIKRVQIPKDLEETIAKYSPRFALRNFTLYLDDPKYSFYVGVLAFAYARMGSGMFHDTGIPEHDKDKWLQMLPQTKKRFYFIIRNGRDGQIMGPLTMPLESYYGAILFESIPPDHNKSIFADMVYKIDVMSGDEVSPILPYSNVPGREDNGIGKRYGKRFEDFLKDGDKSALKEIALVQPCVEHWLYLALFGEEEKRLFSLEGLLAWSRINSPVENPFLSALAMGLFTVNGYAFNDETGVYTMNERGKILDTLGYKNTGKHRPFRMAQLMV